MKKHWLLYSSSFWSYYSWLLPASLHISLQVLSIFIAIIPKPKDPQWRDTMSSKWWESHYSTGRHSICSKENSSFLLQVKRFVVDCCITKVLKNMNGFHKIFQKIDLSNIEIVNQDTRQCVVWSKKTGCT